MPSTRRTTRQPLEPIWCKHIGCTQRPAKPYIGALCHNHLASTHGVRVAGSGVVPGQLGLYAVCNLHTGHTLPYDGLRPSDGLKWTTADMTYSVVHNGEVIVDASNAVYASAARYINATPLWRPAYKLSDRPRLTANCAIIIYDNNEVVMETTRKVTAGTELLCDYGTQYWSAASMMCKLVAASRKFYIGQQTIHRKRRRTSVKQTQL